VINQVFRIAFSEWTAFDGDAVCETADLADKFEFVRAYAIPRYDSLLEAVNMFLNYGLLLLGDASASTLL